MQPFDDEPEEIDDDNDDDPTDPRHPDHDLSTTAEYDFDDYAAPYHGPWFTRRWAAFPTSAATPFAP